jgi:hypothetical protein
MPHHPLAVVHIVASADKEEKRLPLLEHVPVDVLIREYKIALLESPHRRHQIKLSAHKFSGFNVSRINSAVHTKEPVAHYPHYNVADQASAKIAEIYRDESLVA